ncbi:SDR family oxidoreductase [Gracilibacillus sp. YIM 98692]|uniref:SDR family oxidoreductase n=1 Tax=Gracilibacillus sp. YIM 98692 TaxID=2663532 RepID=UPI0013D32517|nr:SDR family oxidoreductase [Gracilibacillus sp. YIM 98692]
MKILVVGANGQIGKHLVRFIQDSGDHQALAMIRNKDQASYFEDLGAETVVVDLERSIDDIANAADGVDAVVFTAGSGPHTGKDKTILVDLDGAVKTIEAAKKANVKRFVLISSFDTRREKWLDASDSFKPYAAAKYYADEWLRSTDLDYTLIHPGKLTNDKGTGKVNAAEEVERDEISREDVAHVIYQTLADETTIGKEFQLVKGSTPIEEAVKSL